MRIGDVAREAGVNIQTLRYYERRGLLAEPARGRSGYRDYGESAAPQVRFIKRAQDLGFSLSEIAELLELRDRARRGRPATRRLAAAKMAAIDEKIRELTAMRVALAQLVDACGRSANAPECPIIEALDLGRPPVAAGRSDV